MKQLEFNASQYKFYETLDICVVCNKPAVMNETNERAKKFAVSNTKLLWGKKKAKVWVKLCFRHMQQLCKPKVLHKFNSKKPPKEQMRLFE